MVRIRAIERPDGTFEVATPEAIATFVDRRRYVVMPVQFGLGHPRVVRMVGADKLNVPRSDIGHRRRLPRAELTLRRVPTTGHGRSSPRSRDRTPLSGASVCDHHGPWPGSRPVPASRSSVEPARPMPSCSVVRRVRRACAW